MPVNLCRLTSWPSNTQFSTRASVSVRAPGDPHSCARSLPGPTDRASRSSIAHPSWPSDQSANFYFWLIQFWPKVSAQTHLLGRCEGTALATPLAPVR